MVSCQLFDYVEIACLYQLKIKINLKSSEEITGIAKTTTHNAERKECIVIKTDKEDNQQVILDEVESIQSLTKNPYFEKISFD